MSFQRTSSSSFFDFYKSKIMEMTEDDYKDISLRFRNGVVVKDRRWYFKSYPQCFVGELLMKGKHLLRFQKGPKRLSG